MKEVRQSALFARFMRDLGWEIEKINNHFIYMRKFPIFGYFAKLPRLNPPFPFKELESLCNKRRIFQLKISPFVQTADNNYSKYKQQLLDYGYAIDMSPFNPTITIQIDLTYDKQQIFDSFSEAKRRGIRRAIKNGVRIEVTNDIEAFIEIRKAQYRPVGFLVASEMRKLWKNFHPRNSALLLAYTTIQNQPLFHIQAIASICHKKPIAGILLLIYDKVAYYWYASALPIGKKLFAPTLLVWEAIKTAKSRGCKILDFEGIYDERFPEAARNWKGFTKFKEGFEGKKIVYMENFQKKDLLNFIR